jgi:hypothetical protein
MADSFGYLGSVFVLFVKEFSGWQLSWINFFMYAVLIVALLGIIGTSIAALYFKRKFDTNPVIKQPIQYAV